ncbi:unnamed protein product [Pedinophyceae sp. YPF-701]|nr:unnamed protein product [Pedinophyceae sp. YPF-701]
MVVRAALAAGILAALAGPALAQAGSGQCDALRLSELRLQGAHNAYHIGLGLEELRGMAGVSNIGFGSRVRDEREGNEATAPLLQVLGYTHPPLQSQLTSGVRALELDVYKDTSGGRYARRALAKAVFATSASGVQALDSPGFKVMHTPDIDYNTHCHTFVECLTQVADWSSSNPSHLPIFIYVEYKTGAAGDRLGEVLGDDPDELERFLEEYLQKIPGEPNGLQTAETAVAADWDAIEAEILAAVPRSQILSPSDARDFHVASCGGTVAADGSSGPCARSFQLPTVADARGKIVFVRANGGGFRFTGRGPSEPDAAYSNSVMFAELSGGDPAAQSGAVANNQFGPDAIFINAGGRQLDDTGPDAFVELNALLAEGRFLRGNLGTIPTPTTKPYRGQNEVQAEWTAFNGRIQVSASDVLYDQTLGTVERWTTLRLNAQTDSAIVCGDASSAARAALSGVVAAAVMLVVLLA